MQGTAQFDFFNGSFWLFLWYFWLLVIFSLFFRMRLIWDDLAPLYLTFDLFDLWNFWFFAKLTFRTQSWDLSPLLPNFNENLTDFDVHWISLDSFWPKLDWVAVSIFTNLRFLANCVFPATKMRTNVATDHKWPWTRKKVYISLTRFWCQHGGVFNHISVP